MKTHEQLEAEAEARHHATEASIQAEARTHITAQMFAALLVADVAVVLAWAGVDGSGGLGHGWRAVLTFVVAACVAVFPVGAAIFVLSWPIEAYLRSRQVQR